MSRDSKGEHRGRATSALERFHPQVGRWFADAFGAPTDVQARCWPRIAAGEHLLVAAPTGSGKTLTAFLWAINAFATGASRPGATRVLYVSPLKALGNDIRANLLVPIAEIRARFEASGAAFPDIAVRVRSGDTDAGERRRLLRRPPELLITTPESLDLLLSTVRGRQALATVETVVLDEIHAVVENRRGVQLLTGLERLVELAGEFQRLALSATARPLEDIAAYIGGTDRQGGARAVGIVSSSAVKRIHLAVRFPEAARSAAENGEKIWVPLAESFRSLIAANRSTLLFTNSRRLAEKIALNVNADGPAPIAYAHHGSLARDIRAEVETRLKAGALKAIVATSSLEMGIDIGDLDEVVMVQSPPSIAAALQRVGRAGHRVGEVSRGSLFPTFAQDFLEAAVIAKAVRERDIEPQKPLANPLDVLAQILVSCAGSEEWGTDELYAMITRAGPYATLPREHFDLVVEMLAGRYAGTRIRDLRPRLAFDRQRQTVKARQGALLALYASGGTIPDRGYFTLRHAGSGAAIGELDEEFVWEASVGQTLNLGNQTWRIERITPTEVLVGNAPPKAAAPPFWRAENTTRSVHFSQRIGVFLEAANALLSCGDGDRLRLQLAALAFEPSAADELLSFLRRQREATQRDLPHANHLLVEHVHSGPGGHASAERQRQVVLHTFWGGRVNQPLALALRAAWRERFAAEADVHADNNVIVAQVPADFDPARLLDLVTPANFETLLRQALESSGFFGARFRECAGRALLITKRRFDQRMPLWMTRLQAKKLLAAARPLPDFPILLETWRACLVDEFDLPAARRALERIVAGDLPWSVASTAVPSPFAAGVAFQQIGRYMYADDTPFADGARPSALRDDLIAQAVFDERLRPAINAAVVADFEARAQRLRSGYAPAGEDELREWVRDRVALPIGEWFAGVPIPRGLLRLQRAGRVHLVHPQAALGEAPFDQAAQLLQFYGPRTAEQLAELLPFDDVPGILAELVENGRLVQGRLLAGSDAQQYCDAENLETLIRFQRAAARPRLEPRPVRDLALFLAGWHGFGADAPAVDAADRLRGYRAPVAFWLREAFAPRLAAHGLATALEDAVDHGLAWRGVGRESITVGLAADLERFCPGRVGGQDGRVGGQDGRAGGQDGRAGGQEGRAGREAGEAPGVEAPGGEDAASAITRLFKDPNARYTFSQLFEAHGGDADAFNDAFWGAVWSGRVAADAFRPLFAGMERQYRLHSPVVGGGARGTRRHARAKARGVALGWPGTWYRAPSPGAERDAVLRLEEGKERCRALLDRYGVLTREQANREGGAFRWAAVFPALRVMELAGEVVGGLFFDGLSGPQFALPQAARQLEAWSGARATFWVNALDPVAPCALGLAGAVGGLPLPQRLLANHLGWLEGQLAVVSEQFAKRLHIAPPPDDSGLDALLAHLAALCRRRRRLDTEVVNGKPVAASPYLPALCRHLKPVADHKGMYFEPL